MILRLWHGRLKPGSESALLERLRAVAPGRDGTAGPLDFTYGFRRTEGRTTFLAISDWQDFDAVRAATGGDISRTIQGVGLDDLFEEAVAETYERLPPEPTSLDTVDGRVIGLVSGLVKPQHEGIAQAMVDHSAGAALQAGAVAAHLGRRLVDGRTQMLIVVIWPMREAMTRFVRSRSMPALDPAFTQHLVEWRFETYLALSPGRLLIPAAGPAILVVDGEGRYVDATPAIEGVLGVPGEMLYGRSILELADRDGRDGLARRVLARRPSAGAIYLRRPDGHVSPMTYRAAPDMPGPGLHAIILARPEDAPDQRSVRDVVDEAFGREAIEVLEAPPPGGLSVAGSEA